MLQSIISIHFTAIELISDDRLKLLLHTLPSTQKNKANLLKNKKRRREFIVGRTLLIKVLVMNNLASQNDILENDCAAPSIKNAPNLYISISHSHNLVSCVLHTVPIGIDIEYKKNKTNKTDISSFFMNQEEFDQLSKLADEKEQHDYFYKIWCAKEAIYKMLSPKQQNNCTLKSISVNRFMASSESELFYHELNNYQVVIAYQGPQSEIQLNSVDLS